MAFLLTVMPPMLPGNTVTGDGSGVAAAQAASLEYQLRAAFLLNFTRYVEWPRKSGDISLCVLGPDPFGSALDDAVTGKVINGRRIVVRRNISSADAARCDLAYISFSQSAQIREALKALETSPVLTVGEEASFLRMGGMIAFAPVDGKIRFYIAGSAAERAGISISSRLMVLAKNDRDEGERRR